MSTPLDKAIKDLTKAFAAYQKLQPKRRSRLPKPVIQPTLLWASPDSFRRGYNMMLDCWVAPAVGKIPVLVVPLNNAPDLMGKLGKP